MLIRPHVAKAAPENAIQAKFSIPFTTAHALVHGSVTLDSFGDAARAEGEVLELAQRVVERRNPKWGRAHAASGSLTLVLHSGERLEREVPHAAGHPGNPLSDTALTDKFFLCASRAAMPLDAGGAPPQPRGYSPSAPVSGHHRACCDRSAKRAKRACGRIWIKLFRITIRGEDQWQLCLRAQPVRLNAAIR